jgi:hypothetical protein
MPTPQYRPPGSKATPTGLTPGPGFRWADPDEPPADQILLTLGPEGRAAVWCLDAPSTSARRRLRCFAWAVIETPGFPNWPEHP